MSLGGHEDVVGLQIAVNDAFRMGSGQTKGDLDGEFGRCAKRSGPCRSAVANVSPSSSSDTT